MTCYRCLKSDKHEKKPHPKKQMKVEKEICECGCRTFITGGNK